MMNPGRQPTADVAAAGDGGEIMKSLQQPAARKPMQNTKSEGRATNAPARDAESRLFLLQPMNRTPDRLESGLRIGRCGTVQRRLTMELCEFRLQHLVQLQ